MTDHRSTRDEETGALLNWHVDLANRETAAKAALAPLEAALPEPEDVVDGLAVALVRSERDRLLQNLDAVATERATWQYVGQRLFADHALDVHQRHATEGLWSSMAKMAETRDYSAFVRRMRGRE